MVPRSPFAPGCLRKLPWRACAISWLLGSAAALLFAQTQSPEAPAGEGDSTSATMTLHVYAAHLQMPTLILDRNLHVIESLPSDRFRIRLDGGAAFAPSSVRLEGLDPIAIAVLLDAGGDADRLAAQIVPALVELRTVALRPEDDLLLYAVDCKTVRYTTPLPYSAAGVEHAVRAVLRSSDLHRGSSLPVCGASLHLWNASASVVTALAAQPGRRVLLTLTGGRDGGSSVSWSSLRSYATANSVAVFAMMSPKLARSSESSESPLWNLCALTGGLLLPVNHPDALPRDMSDLLNLLRHRYILEFPRSNRLVGGIHAIDVQVRQAPDALIRLTGMSVPVLDQRLRDDPSTVPYLEADKPMVGERRPLPPNSPPN